MDRAARPGRVLLRIEQRDRVEGRVRIERRGWQQHVVHSNLPRFSAGERIVQLINVRDGQNARLAALPEQATRVPSKKGMRRGRRGGEFAGSTDKLLLQGCNPCRWIFKACITIEV